MTDGADEPARPEDEAPATTNGTEAAEPMTDDGTAADAPAEVTTAEGESDDFLKNLVGAMRSVAETSRDTSLSELRTAIDARIDALGTQASQRESDIRRQADTDLEGVGEWERTEIDRVKSEAEGKRAARRAKLEEDLAEHRAAAERAVEAARSRLAQHENELAAFFSQLGEITDPAAFVAAAKRMPRAPELEGTTTAAPQPATPVDESPAEASPVVATAETTVPEPQMAEALDTADATESTETTETESTSVTATGSPSAESNGTSSPEDAQLAQRLAQLDERLADTAVPATPTPLATATSTAGGDTSTAIVVKGLGSFGAITSFKQSLERVEGVRGVTLSLGPTGEFVYRASHAADFDIKAAITSIEGPAASIEDTDGTLVVTLSRGR